MNYLEFKNLLQDMEDELMSVGIDVDACTIHILPSATGQVKMTLTQKIVNTAERTFQIHA